MLAERYIPNDPQYSDFAVTSWSSDLSVPAGYMSDCFSWMQKTTIDEALHFNQLPNDLLSFLKEYLKDYQLSDSSPGCIEEPTLFMAFDGLSTVFQNQLVKYYLESQAEVLLYQYHQLCKARGICQAKILYNE